MRKFGKLLVFLNLVLSLIFLGWSLALFTQRMDWAPHKNLFTGEIDQETGKLQALLQDIKQLVEHRELAEARWQTDAALLPRLYEQREAYQKWYKDQVQQARTGKDSTGLDKENDKPVRRLVAKPGDPLGLPTMDPNLREPIKDSRGNDVHSIAYYQQQYEEIKKELETLQAQIQKLIQENEQLTQEISGRVDAKGVLQDRGLRGQLEDRNAYKKLWHDEIAYLRPHVVNQLIHVEEQKRRMAALQARLKELQAGAVAGAGQ